MVNTRRTAAQDQPNVGEPSTRREDCELQPGPFEDTSRPITMKDMLMLMEVMKQDMLLSLEQRMEQLRAPTPVVQLNPQEQFTRDNEAEQVIQRVNPRHQADNMHSIKQRIPEFKGTHDPDEYLEWKDHMERIFRVNNFSEVKKVDLALSEFSDFAAIWWREQERKRRSNGTPEVTTWADLTRQMDLAFIPVTYERDLKVKLQELKQGSRSVQEYYHELIRLRLKARVEEDDASTQARFLQGLNMPIRHSLAVMDFPDINQMVSKATIIEAQKKELREQDRPSGSDRANQWRQVRDDRAKEVPKLPSRPLERNMEEVNKTRPAVSKSSTIQCFKCRGYGHYAHSCPNSRVMILRGDRVDSESEDEDKLTQLVAKNGDQSIGFHGYEEESTDSDSDEPPVADPAKANRIALLHMVPMPDAHIELKDFDEISCTPASGSRLDSRSNPCQPGGNDVVIQRAEEGIG